VAGSAKRFVRRTAKAQAEAAAQVRAAARFVHHFAFLVWAVLIGIHLFAYIRRVPGLIASDWRQYRRAAAPGRGHRLAALRH
jgi:hypothetical protein